MGKIAKKAIPRNRKPATAEFSDNELCARFQKGDFSAFTELSGMYDRLVNTISSKYVDDRLPKSELSLYAKIGLLKAAHRYDESKMVSFRLYAIWWMRQCIHKALNEQSRIEQVPEMLIQNMQEIMESFKSNTLSAVHRFDLVDFTETIEGEITGMKKLKIKKLNIHHS